MGEAIRRFIPNGITLLNLLCGSVATVISLSAVPGNWAALRAAVWFILLGALFDFFDGFAARLLRVQSSLGAQLDSLSDLVTFGMAPAALYVQILAFRHGGLAALTWGWETVFLLSPLLLVLFSAYRLAKFNIDSRQTHQFRGLPTPASALIACGVILGITGDPGHEIFLTFTCCPWKILVLVFFQCFLLVSDIPMFSLKIEHFSLRTLLPHTILLVLAVPTVIFFGLGGIAFVVLEYVLVSLFFAGGKAYH